MNVKTLKGDNESYKVNIASDSTGIKADSNFITTITANTAGDAAISAGKMYTNTADTNISGWKNVCDDNESLNDRISHLESTIGQYYPNWIYPNQGDFSNPNWTYGIYTTTSPSLNMNYLYHKIEKFVKEKFFDTYSTYLKECIEKSRTQFEIKIFGINSKGKADTFSVYFYPMTTSIQEFLNTASRTGSSHGYLDVFGPLCTGLSKSIYVDKCEENNRIWPTFYKISPRKEEYVNDDTIIDKEESKPWGDDLIDEDLPWVTVQNNDLIKTWINSIDSSQTAINAINYNYYNSSVTSNANYATNDYTSLARTALANSPGTLTMCEDGKMKLKIGDKETELNTTLFANKLNDVEIKRLEEYL